MVANFVQPMSVMVKELEGARIEVKMEDKWCSVRMILCFWHTGMASRHVGSGAGLCRR